MQKEIEKIDFNCTQEKQKSSLDVSNEKDMKEESNEHDYDEDVDQLEKAHEL